MPERIWRSSAHFITQSSVNSLRWRRASTSWARLSGRVSARKARSARGLRVETDHVDGHAAHEFLVRAEAGRHDAQLVQALVDGACRCS